MVFVLGALISYKRYMKDYEKQYSGYVEAVAQILDVEKKEDCSWLEVKIISVKDNEANKPDKSIIGNRYIIKSVKEKYMVGNIILVKGNIVHFALPVNEGCFNERQNYVAKGFTGFIKTEFICVISDNHNWLYEMSKRIKECIYDNNKRLFSEEQAAIINGILIGERQDISDETNELFSIAGIAHILSISGMHIYIIGSFVFIILRKRLKYLPASIATVFVVVLYGILIGAAACALRAIIMYIVRLIAYILGRSFDTITALALSAIILIIQVPYIVVSNSFILSYGAILASGVVAMIVKRYLLGVNKLIEAIAYSLSLYIALLPLLAYFYYEIPTYSIIINMLLVPFMPLIVISAIASNVCIVINYTLGSFFAGLGNVLIEFYRYVCKLTSDLPDNMRVTGRPSIETIIIYYSILTVALIIINISNSKDTRKIIEIRKKNIRKQIYRVLMVFSISIVLLLFVYTPREYKAGIYCLDVEQGACTVVINRQQEVLMYDCGSTTMNEVYKYRVEPFLKVKGISKVNACFVSHLDTDHVSGIIDNLETSNSIFIENIIIPDIAYVNNDNYNKLLELALKNNCKISYASYGSSYISKGSKTICYWPIKGSKAEDINCMSLVTNTYFDNISMIATGDIDIKTQDEIIEIIDSTKTDIEANILLVPHHGSKNSINKSFIDRVKPEIALISSGNNNIYGHPHGVTVDTYINMGIILYKTIDKGQITIKL